MRTAVCTVVLHLAIIGPYPVFAQTWINTSETGDWGGRDRRPMSTASDKPEEGECTLQTLNQVAVCWRNPSGGCAYKNPEVNLTTRRDGGRPGTIYKCGKVNDRFVQVGKWSCGNATASCRINFGAGFGSNPDVVAIGCASDSTCAAAQITGLSPDWFEVPPSRQGDLGIWIGVGPEKATTTSQRFDELRAYLQRLEGNLKALTNSIDGLTKRLDDMDKRN
jgi:hypothetical protein